MADAELRCQRAQTLDSAESADRVLPCVEAVARIDASLTIPDGHLRAARVLPFVANLSYWFVIADLQGEGYKGSADVAVWLIDMSCAPGSRLTDLAAHSYAGNALAAGVSNLPDKPMDDRTLARLDSCTQEVLREVSGT